MLGEGGHWGRICSKNVCPILEHSRTWPILIPPVKLEVQIEMQRWKRQLKPKKLSKSTNIYDLPTSEKSSTQLLFLYGWHINQHSCTSCLLVAISDCFIRGIGFMTTSPVRYIRSRTRAFRAPEVSSIFLHVLS